MEINDVIIQEIEWSDGVLTIVKDTDPLLRRFGQTDVIRLSAGGRVKVQREQADEIWTVIFGKVDFMLTDERAESPSFQIGEALCLEAEEPKVVLAPFGVRIEIVSQEDSLLLRMTTHQDETNPGDLLLTGVQLNIDE